MPQLDRRPETGTGTFPRVVRVKRVRCLYGAMLLSREGALPCDELFCGGRPRERSVASSPRCRAVCSTHGPQGIRQDPSIRIARDPQRFLHDPHERFVIG